MVAHWVASGEERKAGINTLINLSESFKVKKGMNALH